MNQVFSDSEISRARHLKRMMLILYFLSLGVFLGIALVLIFAPSRAWSRDNQVVLIIAGVTLTTLFGGFSLFFFGVKFRLVRHYARMFRDMKSGLKDEVVGVFVEFDESLSTKDGLTFYSLVLDNLALRREDISIRKVLIEHTRPKPELTAGQKVRVVTHANILISWEKTF